VQRAERSRLIGLRLALGLAVLAFGAGASWGAVDPGGAASAVVAGVLLLAVAVTGREVQRRCAVEAALRSRAEEIEDLYNLAPCGYHSLDADGVFVRINDTELAWLGYAREEVVGKLRFPDILTPESQQEFARRFPVFKETGEVRGLDFDLLRRDGSILSVALSATAIHDEAGRYVASRSTLFDITERKRLEQERDRFFTLSQDLLCVAGTDGRFLRINPAWERALGYPAEELTSRPFLDFVHPDDRAATIAAFEQQTERGLLVSSFENRYRARDGSYRVLLWTSTPLPHEGVVYASAHDITDRKRAEEALRDAHRQAEAANRELESFSYSVSHDLRAPLRAIDGFSHALLEDCAGQLGDEGRRYLERIVRATGRMSDLIEDLLKLSRLSRWQLAWERVDLGALAQDVLAELARSEPHRQVELHVPRGLVGRGDARLLRILLENLLGNAWKYTRKREPAVIEMGRGLFDGEPGWWVRDNGAGFDMAHADQLFGPFQRLHHAEEFEGTGIGLATAQRIVRLHGGRIWAEAAVDEGATFCFTLGAEAEVR
jgi:PAS domain S-box-containing protein